MLATHRIPNHGRFLYAANPNSSHHAPATEFFRGLVADKTGFLLCELVLIEIYMRLRNPSVLRNPLSGQDAAAFCERLRANPDWQLVDYEPAVSKPLWQWARASSSGSGFRRIIDARLAFTLLHHGVTEFATANVRDFEEFGFDRVWSPMRA